LIALIAACGGGGPSAAPPPGSLVTQCQSLANNFQSKCAGSAPRPCFWAAYAQLCTTGKTQLLIDSMNCLDNTTCRTFSDPNEAAACLGTVHASGESAASKSFIENTCAACGQTSCASTGTGEIIPYLTDDDVTALAHCSGNACSIDTLIQACASLPDVGLFAQCH
jgi:hypothetical protein